jgi:hypothetical protein
MVTTQSPITATPAPTSPLGPAPQPFPAELTVHVLHTPAGPRPFRVVKANRFRVTLMPLSDNETRAMLAQAREAMQRESCATAVDRFSTVVTIAAVMQRNYIARVTADFGTALTDAATTAALPWWRRFRLRRDLRAATKGA